MSQTSNTSYSDREDLRSQWFDTTVHLHEKDREQQAHPVDNLVFTKIYK